MDKLTKKIDIPMAKNMVKKAGLYLVPNNEIDKLAAVAMDAYEDYPLHNWFSGGKYDPKASKIIMQISLKTMTDIGVIYADSPEINGFAVWLPPTFQGSKTLPFLFNGGISLILHSGLGIINKLLTYENYAMNLKKKFTGHFDWYLYNLSVSKKAQGKGIGSKLLRPMLEFSDLEQLTAYLETNKESNVALYEHFGFKLMEEDFIPNSNVKHYAMTRAPKAYN